MSGRREWGIVAKRRGWGGRGSAEKALARKENEERRLRALGERRRGTREAEMRDEAPWPAVRDGRIVVGAGEEDER